jgi:GT2 family glycosyltransferase
MPPDPPVVDARDHEIAALRHALMRIHEDPAFQLGRRLLTLGASLSAPRWFLGRTLVVFPMHQIDIEPGGDNRSLWRLTGNDPHVRLAWGRLPLWAGHYELVIDLEPGAEWDRRMCLYIDSGNGFSEAERADLRFVGRGRRMVASFILPSPTDQLRLDPSDAPGTMSVGRVRLRRLARTEYYGREVLAVARDRLKRGERPSRILSRGFAKFRALGLRGSAAELRARGSAGGASSYLDWIDRYDTLDDTAIAALRRDLAALKDPVRIAVLMPVYNTPEPLLRDAIESVRAQVHADWELCIADDCSTAPHIPKVLKEYAARDKRIRWVRRTENGHISRASNSALDLVTADWVALLDHDDILRPNALAEVAKEIARHPDAEIIYSDEDKLSSKGQRYDPYFKPDFSRELFRSQNYLNHLTVHRTANIRAVGGWRVGFEGSQDYDLSLRIAERNGFRNIRHIPKVLYHWRAVEGSTAVAGSEKDYAFGAGLRALEEHVARTRLAATVEQAPGTPFYRLRLAVPDPAPLVSLIIPTRDKVEILRVCIESILEKTTYENYEIIVVDNGSVETETLTYFAELKARGKARVLKYRKPFNYSAINNFAVARAKGEIVGLINNDIEVITPDWLTEMVSWAVQPDIGCVGAKPYYPNDTIQHAGIVLGVGGVANHAHSRLPRSTPGVNGRAAVDCNWSAVTAACLVVRRSTYEHLGGLDEKDLQVAFNDVDFCLRVRETGQVNMVVPYAELYHHESISRGSDETPEKRARFLREIATMQRRWNDQLLNDPFYSPNYSLTMPAFSFRQ